MGRLLSTLLRQDFFDSVFSRDFLVGLPHELCRLFPRVQSRLLQASGDQLGSQIEIKQQMFQTFADFKHILWIHEQGGVSHETKFNYTLNPAAAQLLQIFEGLARQQEHYELITRRMKYDRLGIYDALLQFESDLNRGLLPEPQRLLPLLEQIANDPKFVDVARKRAQILASRIQR